LEKNEDIIEYFSSYYFLHIDVMYKNYLLALQNSEAKDGYKKLRRTINAYTDQKGKITHIVLGLEEGIGYTVVVEVKTGIVKLADDDKGRMRKIAPSLEEFVRGWEPDV